MATQPKRMPAAELAGIRGKLEYTQADMAKALGVGLRTYARYEAGQRTIPRVVALAARCLAKE